MAYRLTNDQCVIRTEDGAVIPLDPGNADYAGYLAWLATGSAPEPVTPPPALPDYVGFYDALLTSAAYQKVRQQAQQSLPLTLAAVEFVAAISDAKAGKANVAALQACLTNIVALATDLDANDWTEIGALLAENNLADIYELS